MKPLVGLAGLLGLLAVPVLGQVYVPPGGVMPTRGMSPVRMPAVPFTGPAVVIGQIVDAATGRGVAHAIVHLEGQGTEVTRVADNSGRFYVVGLGGGDYAINATKAGYFDGTYGQRRAGGDGLPLSMLEHQWVSDLRIALWRPAVIGGTITDEEGEPLIGVCVEALRKQYDGGALQLVPWMTDVTDDEGEYRLAKLLPGDYVISVPSRLDSLPGFDAKQFAASMLDSQPTALDSEAQARLADSLFLTGNIRLGADGSHALVPGFQNPPPLIDATREEIYATTYYGGTSRVSTALTITVGSGETRSGTNVQLRPVPRGAISGTTVGPTGPIAGQPLRLLLAGERDLGPGHDVAVTQSAGDGTFSFPSVPQGDYVIEAPSNSAIRISMATNRSSQLDELLVTGPMTVSIVSKDDDSGDVKAPLWGRAHVSLADRDVTDVKIEMEPAATVSGQVIFERASATPPDHLSQHIALEALPVGGVAPLSHHAKVDDGGAFMIRGLGRGEYFIRPGPPPVGWYIKAVMSAGHDLLSSPLDLTSIGEVSDLEVIYTDSPTEVGGIVYDARRVPVASATIVAFPAESSYRGTAGQHPDRVRAFRATASGAFHLVALPAGDYFIAAIDESTADRWQDPARLDMIRKSAARVTLHGGDHTALDLQLVTRR